MAYKIPENEPSIEEMMAATKEPSIEEMMAASQGPEEDLSQAPAEVPTAAASDFGMGETLTRTGRSIVKGVTLGASEIPMGYITAASSLIGQGKLDEAKGLLDNLEAWYEADWKRQKQFEKEAPVLATGAEMLGGMVPGGPAAKLATAGLKEGAKFGARMGQAAVTGAAGLGAYTAAETAALPESQRLPIGEQLEQIGTATAAGAAIGPTITAGIEAVGQVPKVLTSAPVLKLANTLLGPPVKVMRQYIDNVAEIGKLPTIDEVNSFFGLVRTELTEMAKQSDQSVLNAQENVKKLEEAVNAEAAKAKGAVSEKLAAAKEQLKLIQEDLKFAAQDAKTELQKAEATQAIALKDPQMGPHVETVNNALDVLKDKIVDQSAAARELITDDVFFNTQDVINAWLEQAKKLRVQGTDVARGGSAKQALSVIQERVKEASQLPPRMTGQQLKDLIQGYDRDIADGLLQPGRFGKYYDTAIKSVRKTMDTQLKAANEDYRVALEPVAKLQNQLEEVLTEFGSGKPGAIESSLRKAVENPRVYAVLERLEAESGLPILNVVKEGQKNRAEKEAIKKFGPASLPEYTALQNVRAQQELAKAEQFDRAVFEAIKDTPVAQQIIDLRRQIKNFSDPEYVQAEVAKATERGQLSLEQAQQTLANLEQQREEAGKWMRQLIGQHISKPEDLTAKILRAADNPVEQAQATKIIEAVSQLPPAQFKELLEMITLKNPQDAQRLFRNLRIEEAMSKARTNGSRRVNLVRAIMAGLGAGAGGTMGPAAATVLGGFGALAGGYLDEHGAQIAKAYLRNAVKLQGIPNLSKMLGLAPVKTSAALRNATLVQLSDMAAATDPEAVYFVSDALKPAVERDIQQSKMSAVDRAKALNELNSLGGVSGKYVRKIMMDSVPPATQAVQPEVRPTLEADKPDMLQRLTKRADKTSKASLRQIIERMS